MCERGYRIKYFVFIDLIKMNLDSFLTQKMVLKHPKDRGYIKEFKLKKIPPNIHVLSVIVCSTEILLESQIVLSVNRDSGKRTT